MNEFILSLFKYTSILICVLYTYAKLLRLKLKVLDLSAIPLFIALSAVLHFATVHIKILVPAGILLFVTVFLYLRFKRPVSETVTVSIIAFAVSIAIYVFVFTLSAPVTATCEFIKNDDVSIILANSIVSVLQILAPFLLFKIKRFRSGVDPNGDTATFEILLFSGICCIISMTLFYTDQSLYEIVLIASAVCSLLLILRWRRHITYNYREAMKRRKVKNLEEEIAECELRSAENKLQVTSYSKTFHYLNKSIPHCTNLADKLADDTGCEDACALRNMLHRVSAEINVTNEKCSFMNIPLTGVRVIDMPVYELYTLAETKNIKVSADVSADVKSWFSDDGLDTGDIHILLSYLCDNAVHSALGLPNPRVRIEFTKTPDNAPVIRIYDSGKQFDEKVLAKLGSEIITTRAGSGGSGIGLFTVFGILAKYNASFFLDETSRIFGFNKFLEITFDNLRSVTLRTSRFSVVNACSHRADIRVLLPDASACRDGTEG